MTSLADRIAQHIRTVDGDHSMGAGELAESIVEGLNLQEMADAASIAVFRGLYVPKKGVLCNPDVVPRRRHDK